MKKTIELYVTKSSGFSKKLVYDVTSNRGNLAMKKDIVHELNDAHAFSIYFFENDELKSNTQILPTYDIPISTVIEQVNELF